MFGNLHEFLHLSNMLDFRETLFQITYDIFTHVFLLVWVSAIKLLHKTVLLIHEQQIYTLHCVTKLPLNLLWIIFNV